ncbi:hypothetical protein V8E51_011535 [Hyaloscypha variabilis]
MPRRSDSPTRRRSIGKPVCRGLCALSGQCPQAALCFSPGPLPLFFRYKDPVASRAHQVPSSLSLPLPLPAGPTNTSSAFGARPTSLDVCQLAVLLPTFPPLIDDLTPLPTSHPPSTSLSTSHTAASHSFLRFPPDSSTASKDIPPTNLPLPNLPPSNTSKMDLYSSDHQIFDIMMVTLAFFAATTSAAPITSGPQVTSVSVVTTVIEWIDQVPLYNELVSGAKAAVDSVVPDQIDGCGMSTSTNCFCITSYTQLLASISSIAMVKCASNATDVAMATSCFVSYCEGALGARFVTAAPSTAAATSLAAISASTTVAPVQAQGLPITLTTSTSMTPSSLSTSTSFASYPSLGLITSKATLPSSAPTTIPSTTGTPTPPPSDSGNSGLTENDKIAIGVGLGGPGLVDVLSFITAWLMAKRKEKRNKKASERATAVSGSGHPMPSYPTPASALPAAATNGSAPTGSAAIESSATASSAPAQPPRVYYNSNCTLYEYTPPNTSSSAGV